MMRPMFVEFPEDRACEPLDKQYMLGDSLLVAPVFKESGEVEYYLPEGVWVNLLTGTTVKGGRWQKETHDYFSLPLMVRPGSIVAVGQESSRPDYDFADGVRFLLWLPEEGMTAETGVTDLNGNVVMTVSAGRADGKITLRAERTSAGVSADVSTNFTFEVLGEEKLEVVVK